MKSRAFIFYSKIFSILIISGRLLTSSSTAFAQGSAGENTKYEPRYLIDLPTAGMIPHSHLAFDFDFFQNGGLLTCISIGAFDHLLIGVSYGGIGIIGNEKPAWNSIPGFQLRFRFINETIFFPAIAVGFNSQGKEFYKKNINRYIIKSLGFYAVASKNYKLLGNFSLHGGVNYSLERADGDRDPNIFIGAEKSIGPIISLLSEYDLGWNDSHNNALGKGRGYLNLGIRLSIGNGLSIGLNLKDILKNQNEITVGNRTIIFEYIQSL